MTGIRSFKKARKAISKLAKGEALTKEIVREVCGTILNLLRGGSLNKERAGRLQSALSLLQEARCGELSDEGKKILRSAAIAISLEMDALWLQRAQGERGYAYTPDRRLLLIGRVESNRRRH